MLKWYSKARVRFLLGSITIDFLLAVLLLGIISWANQPILHPSDPLAPRYFVSYYLRPYGWVLTFLFSALSVIFQFLITKWTLHFVDSSPSRWHYFIPLLFVASIILGASGAQLFGDFAFSHFLIFCVGFLTPGLWPAYLLVRSWENQHQQTLIMQGFTYKTMNE